VGELVDGDTKLTLAGRWQPSPGSLWVEQGDRRSTLVPNVGDLHVVGIRQIGDLHARHRGPSRQVYHRLPVDLPVDQDLDPLTATDQINQPQEWTQQRLHGRESNATFLMYRAGSSPLVRSEARSRGASGGRMGRPWGEEGSPNGWPKSPTCSKWLDSPDVARLYGPKG